MRLLHTADWHLGHTLRDHSREFEHAQFLAWLVQTIVVREVDALLIAGDVFDSANPTPVAWRMWFQFLGELKRARPGVQVVVIAGNHDSAARLEAPRELLTAFGVRVVGGIERDEDGRLRTENLLVPLHDRAGARTALCVAIPFLRGSDVAALVPAAPPSASAPMPGEYVLPTPGTVVDEGAAGDASLDPLIDPQLDPLIGGMRALHDELFTAARALLQPGQALVAMAHGYLVGGALSELSERKVLGGNQHALPLDLFPADCAYIALGHLHRPQVLAGRDHIRYCGSPIPLSMPERLHAHHVVFVDLDGAQMQKVWSLRVPRTVEMLRLPERGELEPDAALAAVAALPPRDAAADAATLPFVEVAVRLPQPSPQIAERIARAIESRAARLVRVDAVLTGSGASATAHEPQELAQLSPEDVFLRRYQRDHEGPLPDDLLAAFRDLLGAVEHGGEA